MNKELSWQDVYEVDIEDIYEELSWENVYEVDVFGDEVVYDDEY